MAFESDIAFALELIAMALGAFLFIAISKEKELCCRNVLKVISYIILVGSFLTMACTIINSFKASKAPPPNERRMQFNPRKGSRGDGESRVRPGNNRQREMMQREEPTEENSPPREPREPKDDENFPPSNEGNP